MAQVDLTLIETLRAVPTGHAPHAQGTAQDIAQALGVTPAQVANRLGRLRRLGLVTRDAQGNGAGVSTWARFDSFAPGLEAAQVAALERAERAAPCRFQRDALESFGPECEAAPHGLALRSDLEAETRAALEARTPEAIAQAARATWKAGRPQRAANLYREAARHCAGHGRRARYESTAQDLEAQAEAEAQERGAFGMGTAIPPVDAPAPAQDLEARRAQVLAPLAQANANRKRAESAQDWTARAEAEAAQVAALPQVLAFLDARPVAHGLKVAPRHYVCRVCGNVESFSTNHTGPHYSACGACSWRGGRDDSGRYYSAQDKGRPHVYSGANPRGQGEENPHARAQVKAEALPQAGDVLGNGAKVLDVRGTLPRAYVLAFTAGLAGHPFAVWRLEAAPRGEGQAPAWGTYSGDYFGTLGDALKGLEARAQVKAEAAQAPAPVAWRTGSDVTMNRERAENWQAMGAKVWALVDAAQGLEA